MAQNVVSLVRSESNDMHGLEAGWSPSKENSKAVIRCWSEMISYINDSFEDKPNAKTQNGLPKEAEQCVMTQHGAIELTIALLKLLLAASRESLEQSISKRTVLILFRFLQLLVKGSTVNCAHLNRHMAFLYQHLNSDYQVALLYCQCPLVSISFQVACCTQSFWCCCRWLTALAKCSTTIRSYSNRK